MSSEPAPEAPAPAAELVEGETDDQPSISETEPEGDTATASVAQDNDFGNENDDPTTEHAGAEASASAVGESDTEGAAPETSSDSVEPGLDRDARESDSRDPGDTDDEPELMDDPSLPLASGGDESKNASDENETENDDSAVAATAAAGDATEEPTNAQQQGDETQDGDEDGDEDLGDATQGGEEDGEEDGETSEDAGGDVDGAEATTAAAVVSGGLVTHQHEAAAGAVSERETDDDDDDDVASRSSSEQVEAPAAGASGRYDQTNSNRDLGRYGHRSYQDLNQLIEGFDLDFDSGGASSSNGDDDDAVEGLRFLHSAETTDDASDALAEADRLIKKRTLERDALFAETAALEARIATALARQRGEKSGGGGGMRASAHVSLNEETQREDETEFRAALVRWREIRDLRRQVNASFEVDAVEVETRLVLKTKSADEVRSAFVEKMQECGKNSVSEKTGKPISKTSVQRRIADEQTSDELLTKSRLAHVFLRRTKLALEKKVKQKEHLAEGLKLIDFEQLKMETVSLKDKFAERGNDYVKIKHKTSDLIQILTHAKEKLQFTTRENADLKTEMARVDSASKVKGDVMQRLKDDIETLTKENENMQSEAATITNPVLLDDYADQKLLIKTFRKRLVSISAELEELNFGLAVSQKITAGRTTDTAKPHTNTSKTTVSKHSSLFSVRKKTATQTTAPGVLTL
jgi:hypothetical protein